MESNKSRFLIVILFFIFFSFPVSANDKIDTMCGNWTHRNERHGKYLDKYWTLSIQKISEEQYFILYSSNAENHVLDLSEIGMVENDNLIKIHKDEGEDFYVYFDYQYDSVFFLWNHTYPDAEVGDVCLKRVTEFYDEELNNRKKEILEDNLKKSILDSLKK